MTPLSIPCPNVACFAPAGRECIWSTPQPGVWHRERVEAFYGTPQPGGLNVTDAEFEAAVDACGDIAV